MSLCIENFQGIVPRESPELLGANIAACAENVKLWHGRLDPWREPKFVQDLGSSTGHWRDCCWRSGGSDCTKFHDGRLGTRTYVSDGCGCPLVVEDWCGNDSGTALGFPCPPPPTIISNPNAPDEVCTDLRTYFITLGDECDEGQPSMPSEFVKARPEDEVCLAWSIDPAEIQKYGVTKVRIYRTMATWDIETSPVPSNGTNNGQVLATEGVRDAGCFLVACIDISEAQYCDGGKVQEQCIGRSLESLEGLCVVGETLNNSLVGFTEDLLYFSERLCHHAWPIKYQMKFDCPIRNVCVYNNTVWVLTDGPVYIVQDDADCTSQGNSCRSVNPVWGDYRPQSHKAVICTPLGVVFPTSYGLMRIDPTGVPTNLSENHFAPDNWEAIMPWTMRAVECEGSLFFTTDNFSGIWDLNLNGFGMHGNRSNLSTLKIKPDCWIKTKNGCLYFTLCNKLYQWDAGEKYMPFRWVSSRVQLYRDQVISAGKIEFSNVQRKYCNPCPATVTLLGDGCETYSRAVEHSRPFRTCPVRHRDLAVEVTSESSIRRICFGTGFSRLTRPAV